MEDVAAHRVAELMGRFRNGDQESARQLVELLYPQLKTIASALMRREATPHTWQPTALVNELYLELVKVRALQAGDADASAEKEAFLQFSAFLMRRLLIHHSRPLARRMPREQLDLDAGALSQSDSQASLSDIDRLLERLGALDPQLRTLVELRVFEGMTNSEIAERMGCSDRTVSRLWTFARGWLGEQLG